MLLPSMNRVGATIKGWFGTEVPVADVGRLADAMDPDNEIGPGDREDTTTPRDALEERRLVEFVRGRFADAARARMGLERDWVLSLAMEEGEQWLGWDERTHRAESLKDEAEEGRYVTDNLVRPLILKWQALVTMTKPDCSPAPQTDTDRDRMAASEARAILAHCDRRHRQPVQALRRAYWCAVTGIGWDKLWWDPSARADIPIYGPDGTLQGKQSAPVGDVCREVVSPFEIFLDPGATTWERCGWLFHSVQRPLSWFQEKFGERGLLVDSEASNATGLAGDYVGAYLSAPSGGTSRRGSFEGGRLIASGEKSKSAICHEYWEKPSPRYPQGRYVVVAGMVLLHAGPLPYVYPNGESCFPFVRTVYQEAAGHGYGRGLVSDLVPLQVAYNRLLSRMVERTEEDKATLLLDKSSGVGPDAYEDLEETRAIRKVYYNLGATPPVWQPPPGVGGDNYRVREIIWGDMQHIAGIHDVNLGGTPTGVTAGISIELLQQGDRTQMGVFLQQLEQAEVEIGRWLIALYGQFASPFLPRLMGLDNSGNADAAHLQAQSFAALTAGGSCEVIVVPGSSTPKSAAGQNNEILEFFRAGLFDPQNPAAEVALSLMRMSRSDEVLERMQAIRERQAAFLMEQQRMQAAQEQQMQQAQNGLPLGGAPESSAFAAFGSHPPAPTPGGHPDFTGRGGVMQGETALPPGGVPPDIQAGEFAPSPVPGEGS